MAKKESHFQMVFHSNFPIIEEINLGTTTKTEEDIICSPREGHPQAPQILINIFFHNFFLEKVREEYIFCFALIFDKVNPPKLLDYFLNTTTPDFGSMFLSK